MATIIQSAKSNEVSGTPGASDGVQSTAWLSAQFISGLSDNDDITDAVVNAANPAHISFRPMGGVSPLRYRTSAINGLPALGPGSGGEGVMGIYTPPASEALTNEANDRYNLFHETTGNLRRWHAMMVVSGYTGGERWLLRCGSPVAGSGDATLGMNAGRIAIYMGGGVIGGAGPLISNGAANILEWSRYPNGLVELYVNGVLATSSTVSTPTNSAGSRCEWGRIYNINWLSTMRLAEAVIWEDDDVESTDIEAARALFAELYDIELE